MIRQFRFLKPTLKYFKTCRFSTFVSQHFRLNNHELSEFLDSNKLTHKTSGSEVVIKECPFCHDTKGLPSNHWKLYIHKDSGAYNCFRCGNKGSWYDFKLNIHNSDSNIVKLVNPNNSKPEVIPNFTINNQVIEYLNKRRLSAETAAKYGVGSTNCQFMDEKGDWKTHPCITFPLKVGTKTVRQKIRSIMEKGHQKLDPVGGKWGLFGLDLVPEGSKEIIMTEGEFDAMAVYQATGRPAVSVPNGCRSLPLSIMSLLEKYEKIYLWMDDDVPGQEGVDLFTKKLGLARCYVCHSKAKDANEALQKGMDLNEVLRNAAPLQHEQIVTYTNLKDRVKTALYSKNQAGVKSLFFPKLNNIIKGHRRGELTLVTGPTGVGKTTILSQMSLDYCLQGVNTLWGSFEIKNHNLVKNMICQMAGKNLGNYPQEFDKYSEQFERYPLYFMDFYGSTDINQVLDAMDYSCYVHDVKHVIIDNLTFMLSGQGLGFEKFDLQDKVIEKLRNFATNKGVHISLVLHPKKIEDEQMLGLSSFGGTAKATQEADNVLIIQNGKKYRSLSIKKNRFDGHLGSVAYRFDRESKRIYELTDEEIKNVESGKLELNY